MNPMPEVIRLRYDFEMARHGFLYLLRKRRARLSVLHSSWIRLAGNNVNTDYRRNWLDSAPLLHKRWKLTLYLKTRAIH